VGFKASLDEGKMKALTAQTQEAAERINQGIEGQMLQPLNRML